MHTYVRTYTHTHTFSLVWASSWACVQLDMVFLSCSMSCPFSSTTCLEDLDSCPSSDWICSLWSLAASLCDKEDTVSWPGLILSQTPEPLDPKDTGTLVFWDTDSSYMEPRDAKDTGTLVLWDTDSSYMEPRDPKDTGTLVLWDTDSSYMEPRDPKDTETLVLWDTDSSYMEPRDSWTVTRLVVPVRLSLLLDRHSVPSQPPWLVVMTPIVVGGRKLGILRRR